jgi:hypothetical protein
MSTGGAKTPGTPGKSKTGAKGDARMGSSLKSAGGNAGETAKGAKVQTLFGHLCWKIVWGFDWG